MQYRKHIQIRHIKYLGKIRTRVTKRIALLLARLADQLVEAINTDAHIRDMLINILHGVTSFLCVHS